MWPPPVVPSRIEWHPNSTLNNTAHLFNTVHCGELDTYELAFVFDKFPGLGHRQCSEYSGAFLKVRALLSQQFRYGHAKGAANPVG